MTHTEALGTALAALHTIAGAITSRQLLSKGIMNPVLRVEIEKKALTDQQIANTALDTWEAIVTTVEPQLPGTMIFECSPSEGDS